MNKGRLSFRDRVAHYFKAHPGEWVSAYQLAKFGGLYAWRTRVSDCRLELDMEINNRVRLVPDGTVSEYQYRPKADAADRGVEQGHDTNAPASGRLL